MNTTTRAADIVYHIVLLAVGIIVALLSISYALGRDWGDAIWMPIELALTIFTTIYLIIPNGRSLFYMFKR